MKLGLIVRGDKTGLGYQTLDYYKHLKPTKTLLINMQPLNGMVTDQSLYPDAMVVNGLPNRYHLEQFLDGIDVLFTAESPYNPDLYDIARKRGVKTAVIYNWEFFDWYRYPHLPKPDMLIAPSVWHFDEVDWWAKEHGIKHIQLHHPVDRDVFTYRVRENHEPLHIAGKPAVHDRNGTWDFLEAVPNGTVVTQSEDLAYHIRKRFSSSTVYTKIDDANFMYQLGDFMVLPRKYGGNCLPLNEALSCGLPVIMPDIEPNNHLLPKEWLVPATITDYFEPRAKVPIYSVDKVALYEKVRWFKSTDMRVQSEIANQIADTISWQTLKPKYIEALESLCTS